MGAPGNSRGCVAENTMASMRTGGFRHLAPPGVKGSVVAVNHAVMIVTPMAVDGQLCNSCERSCFIPPRAVTDNVSSGHSSTLLKALVRIESNRFPPFSQSMASFSP